MSPCSWSRPVRAPRSRCRSPSGSSGRSTCYREGRPMNDEKEKQQADQDTGKPKILAEPRAWWKLDPETRKTFNAVSGAVGSISGIITIAALFVHGNIAILLWSAGVDVA